MTVVNALPENIKNNIQLLYSDFLRNKNLRPRLGQKQMIAEIARLCAPSEEADLPTIGCIEAGTGTGKTLAYLIGALPISLESNDTLVISTATVSLQSQLIEKDLPDLVDATGLNLTWALAKGRRRYLCPTRIEAVLDSIEGSTKLYPDEFTATLDDDDQRMVKSLSTAWISGEWLGDMDQISDRITETVRVALTTDHHRCQSRSCRNFNICPYFRDREKWTEVDILIINHDLLISDIKLGGGIILPALESIILVVDEAHQLPRVACDHFTEHVRLAQCLGAIKAVDRVCKIIHGYLPDEHSMQRDLSVLPKKLEDFGFLLANWGRSTLAALNKVDESELGNERGRLRYRLSIHERFSSPKSGTESSKKTLSRLHKIQDWLKQISQEGVSELPSVDVESLSQQLAISISRLESIPYVEEAFSELKQTNSSARWVNVGQDYRCSAPDDPSDVEFWVSPLTSANSLEASLWRRIKRAVMTSATLAHGDSFQTITQSLGIFNYRQLIVESSFNYTSQGRLVISQFAGNPKNEEEHAARIIKYLVSKSESTKGILVLFTSWRLMNRVEDLLPDNLIPNVLIQGQTNVSRLIELHKENRKESYLSIIFGLQSLSEGIDLPGDLADEIVITRLPFPPPDDPRDATQAEYLKSLGLDPFSELSLPQATIRLRQAVGRLIRSETDTGQITVLDRRLINTAWGRRLLKELPSFQFFKE